MIKSKIIAAFPGTGKSTYYREHSNCLDSDSSDWSWLVVDGVKERHPEWPNNYINHIKENIDNIQENLDLIIFHLYKKNFSRIVKRGTLYNIIIYNEGLS